MFFLPAISVEGRSGGQSMSKDLCSKCESELMIICDGEITKIDNFVDELYFTIKRLQEKYNLTNSNTIQDSLEALQNYVGLLENGER